VLVTPEREGCLSCLRSLADRRVQLAVQREVERLTSQGYEDEVAVQSGRSLSTFQRS
jgi:hypothetical protein